MYNPQNMTPGQADEARTRTFYLLKKFTSLTYASKAVACYRKFIESYERQLDTPRGGQDWFEEKFLYCFLPKLILMEEGIEALGKGQDKGFAYNRLIIANNDFPLYAQEGRWFTKSFCYVL